MLATFTRTRWRMRRHHIVSPVCITVRAFAFGESIAGPFIGWLRRRDTSTNARWFNDVARVSIAAWFVDNFNPAVMDFN